jgi:hypothetical protein
VIIATQGITASTVSLVIRRNTFSIVKDIFTFGINVGVSSRYENPQAR